MPSLTHVALHVPDLDASAAFFRDYCGLAVVHERGFKSSRVLWLAESGRETSLVFVLIPGGVERVQDPRDFGHLGFALSAREDVDAIAAKARAAGRLVFEPRQEDYPVGYYCFVRAPCGRSVEFSYGQPLGPGAEDEEGA